MAEPKFYLCGTCGNLVISANGNEVSPTCCGNKLEALVPNSTDAAQEKHVPVIERVRDGHALRITVGAVEHPMTEAHYIQWIALAAEGRVEVHYLKPGDKPETFFGGVEHGTAYAYCNLHGLWKAEF